MDDLTPQKNKQIRLLLVDDSPVALLLLRRAVTQDPQIVVVGTARDGAEALRLVRELKPDVVSTDLHMPIMNGLELTQRIMAECPCPVLVCSTAVQSDNAGTVFDLLQAGALDVFPKPRTGLEGGNFSELIRKIKVLAGVTVFRNRRPISGTSSPAIHANLSESKPRAVVIGASTGGPGALQTLFQAIPGDFPLPILCVQHIAADFAKGLISWLADQSNLTVAFATAGEKFRPGSILFPAPGTNLLVSRSGMVELQPLAEDSVGPSVDMTMNSVASVYGSGAIGVLLTGMGSDGAQGMLAISQAGGMTIAQNAQTSVIFGMPERAIALGAVQSVLPLGEIAPTLLRLAANRSG